MFTNFYNVNPAATGFDGAFISQLTVSKKWMGIDGSPANQVLSNSIRLGEEEFYDPSMHVNRPFINLAPRVGIGFSIFNESSGPLRHTGLLLAYAYHISIGENRLSFGLSGMVSQYHLNIQEIKPINTDDLDLYTNNTAIVPDVNFGALYYNSMMFVGVSANSLVNFNKIMDHTKTTPEIVVCGGYRFKIANNFKFEPSLFLFKYLQGAMSADFNTKLYYHNKNWLQFSYKSQGELLAGIGLSINSSFQFCYNYAININGLATYYEGSQSISLRADISTLLKKRNW